MAALRQRNFKNSEEIERKDQNDDAQYENKIRIRELKAAPGNIVAGDFEADQDQGQTNEPGKNASGKSNPAAQNLAPALPGVLNESENFERDDRQHARHQIQNDSAEESEEEKRKNAARWRRTGG